VSNLPFFKKAVESLGRCRQFLALYRKHLRRRLREAARGRDVVVSFFNDPYPPWEAEDAHTRMLYAMLAGKGVERVYVVTKNPVLALRDAGIFVETGLSIIF